MNPIANGCRWTEMVPAKVLTLTLEGCEKNRPFGMVKVEVLRSEVGDFHTTFFADPDAFQTAIDCFKNNELIEFKGDFEGYTDIVRTGRVSDVRVAEDEMKNTEVAEIFDDIIVNLSHIVNRLEQYRDWIRSGRTPDLSYENWLMKTPIETPDEYMEYILGRLKITRDFYQAWRKEKKL